jgi:hypothetical protein
MWSFKKILKGVLFWITISLGMIIIASADLLFENATVLILLIILYGLILILKTILTEEEVKEISGWNFLSKYVK